MFFTLLFISFTHAVHSVLWSAFASSTAVITYISEMSRGVESQQSSLWRLWHFSSELQDEDQSLLQWWGGRFTLKLLKEETYNWSCSSWTVCKLIYSFISLGNKRVNSGRSWWCALKSMEAAPVTSRVRAHPQGQCFICAFVMKNRHCLFIVLCGEGLLWVWIFLSNRSCVCNVSEDLKYWLLLVFSQSFF